jgi:hypothetical protein
MLGTWHACINCLSTATSAALRGAPKTGQMHVCLYEGLAVCIRELVHWESGDEGPLSLRVFHRCSTFCGRKTEDDGNMHSVMHRAPASSYAFGANLVATSGTRPSNRG